MTIPEEIADELSRKMGDIQNQDLSKYKSVLASVFTDSINKEIKSVLGVSTYGGLITNQLFKEKLENLVKTKLDTFFKELNVEDDIKRLRRDFVKCYQNHLNNLIDAAARKKAEEDFNNFIGEKNGK